MRTRASPWVAAGVLVALALLPLAELLSPDVVLVTLFVTGPLIAAVGGDQRATAGVAVLALALACLELFVLTSPVEAQDFVRTVTVALGGGLAVVLATLRERLERSGHESRELTRQAEETLALLDVIYERAPVGLAFYDRGGRYVRINDRLAEINGLPPADHLGRTVPEVLPGLPEVAAEVEAVARTGEPAIAVEITGETPAQPGVEREWLASYWPVRTRGDAQLAGIGAVVFEVTERRAAERALRMQTDRYETLLTALSEVGEGMVIVEDERCVYANGAFEQLSGYTFPELAAMESLFALVDEEEREEAARRARLRAERDVVDPGYQLSMRRRDGGKVLLELAGVPLEIPGSPPRRQLVVVVRDITARRHAEDERERLLHRSALLAEASALFDRSLDEERTLRRVAALCVRDLSDTCLVVLGAPPAGVRRAIAAARRPERERAQDVEDALAGKLPSAVLDVLRTGSSTVVQHHDGGGMLVVPLSARGRVLGALAAGFDRLAMSRRDEEITLLEDLGRRAALALDNARLYAERTATARTLQRSLLPPELPAIPGAEIAARYLAAGSGNEVGGDFYDCFATGGGDWALLIGDVCGKGAEAAAVTALARYTLRAAVLHSREPARVLTELNEALLRQEMDYRFCTVLYASVTPRAGGLDVVLATGGHPLPLLLRAGGSVETVGSPGTLLGIVEQPDISSEQVSLAEGDSLVLFTDGVVEASPSDDALGPSVLASHLADLSGRDAARIAEAIERKALDVQGGHLRDDVAVLVLRVPPGGAEAPFDAPEQGVAAPT
jgi:PAS domain S-box-containing protein